MQQFYLWKGENKRQVSYLSLEFSRHKLPSFFFFFLFPQVIDYQEAIKNPRTFKYIHQTSSNKTRKLKRKLSGKDVHDEECEEWVLPKAPSGKGFIIYPTGFLLCGFTWDAALHRVSVTFSLYKGKAEQPPSHLTK